VHVAAQSPHSRAEIADRFASLAQSRGDGRLRYAAERQPPKCFLQGLPWLPPAAAEVALDAVSDGTDVVLRLMWGPLPAPFPRAVAGLGVLVALAGLWLAPLLWWLWLLLGAVPVAMLVHQRTGERQLQHRLAELLGVGVFAPRAH